MKAGDGSAGKAKPRPNATQAREKVMPILASLSDLQAQFSTPK